MKTIYVVIAVSFIGIPPGFALTQNNTSGLTQGVPRAAGPNGNASQGASQGVNQGSNQNGDRNAPVYPNTPSGIYPSTNANAGVNGRNASGVVNNAQGSAQGAGLPGQGQSTATSVTTGVNAGVNPRGTTVRTAPANARSMPTLPVMRTIGDPATPAQQSSGANPPAPAMPANIPAPQPSNIPQGQNEFQDPNLVPGQNQNANPYPQNPGSAPQGYAPANSLENAPGNTGYEQPSDGAGLDTTTPANGLPAQY